jgi:hypothetical protein
LGDLALKERVVELKATRDQAGLTHYLKIAGRMVYLCPADLGLDLLDGLGA